MPPTAGRLAALIAVVVFAGPASAQKGVVPLGLAPAAPDKPPARTDNGLFTLPEQRDAKEQLRAVTDYLGRTDIPWAIVTTTAQRLLDAKSDSFFRVKDAKGDDTGAVVSVKAKVNQILAELPKAGRQFYEQEFGGAAQTLLKQATDAGGDRPLLADVSQRYFHTRAGSQATLLLAGADLAAGRVRQAAYGYARLLARPDDADTLPPRALFRAAVALKRAGGATAADLLDRALRGVPADGLVIGRRAYSADELRAEFDRAAPESADPDRFPATRLGNPARAGVADAGTPFLDPALTTPLVTGGEEQFRDGEEWVRQTVLNTVRKASTDRKQVVIPGFFPVAAPGVVVYRAYDGVHAVATQDGVTADGRAVAAGDVVWRVRGFANGEPDIVSGGAQTLFSRGDAQDVTQWWNTAWANQAPQVLYENAALGSLTHDGGRVYFVDDLAVLPPPAAAALNGGFPNRQQGGDPAGSTAPARMSHYSRLFAVDLASGSLAWTVGGPEQKPLTEAEEAASTSIQALSEGGYFLGPPLAVDGKLYVLYERRGQVRLACLDPARTPTGAAGLPEPALVWSQVIGDATTSVRGDPLRRMQPCHLAYADGVLVCPTNCGVVVAVDIYARSLLWARFTGTPPDPKQAQADPFAPPGVVLRGRRIRDDGRPLAPVPTDRWRAAAPIVSAGKVLLAGYDSDLLQCLDLRTGEPVWSTPREPDDVYVGGVVAGNVVVVGKKAVRAYTLAGDGKGGRRPAWPPTPTGPPTGHGAAGKDGLYYLPVLATGGRADRQEPQVWAVDAGTGAVKAKTGFRRPADPAADPRLALGNLVFHGGLLFSQTPLELAAFPLLEPKRREMEARLKANPADPDGLVTRGELALDAGDVRAAVRDFKAARAQSPPEPTRRRLAHKLYAAYTELARSDFQAVEPDLAEYEALCAVPADSPDPAEKSRQVDDGLHRKALYLTLVGRGREAQGRPADALAAYRAFAALGGGQQLVAVDGEANGLTRPDVWARGKIEALMRPGPARAELTAVADREWADVRTANDLPRLREFVAVFGPHVPAGQAARLLLADRLLATNNDGDGRDAQSLLMRVWATADAPADAAAAVDRLARHFAARGRPDDAVSLYGVLGTKYAAVPVRAGQTGADVYAEVVADRRLHPYLEPGRAAVPADYTVRVTPAAAQARAVRQGFTLVPDGDLFPSYRRYRLVMEPNPADATWALRVTDPATGDDRAKFSGLGAGLQVQNGGPPPALSGLRVGVASGHLVLLNIGHMVYCLDLAESREAWRANLLGRTPPGGQPQPPVEENGELTYRYEDGWAFRLGRSTVLQPTYACLLTRDGLKAVDPATGLDLWTRTNVSARAAVFGDARHVFLVEPAGTTVLRAADGGVVADAPDFLTKYNSSNRVGTVGRNLLMSPTRASGRTVELYDPLTGGTVWSKSYPAGTAVVRTVDPAVTGVVQKDGRFELLAAADGGVVAAGRIDADLAAKYLTDRAGRTTPLALLDAERVYLVLERPAAAGRRVGYSGYAAGVLKTAPADGPVVAFDRATGRRLWYNADSLAGQQLVLEQFDAVPVLVALSANAQAWDGSGVAGQARLVVLDKRTGKLRHDYGYAPTGSFLAAVTDPKTRAVEFVRPDLSVRVGPAADGDADTPAP